jgi:hypothetical protein
MMIRAIPLTAMLGGALVASVAVYAISPPGWRDMIAPLLRGLDRGAETAITPEDGPICTTMASIESDADWAQLDPDFKPARGRWARRIGMAQSQRSSSPHCATRLMPISRTTSAMPIGGCASWGRLLAIISRR